MDNKVLISIINADGTYTEDFEIPATVKVSEWIGQLQVYFYSSQQKYFPQQGTEKPLKLYFNKRILGGSDTLQSVGVTRGSILIADWR